MKTLDPTSAHWPMLLLRGILAVIFGAIALLMPLPTIQALVLVAAAFLIADGIMAAVAAIAAARARAPWGGSAFHAVLNIAAGVIIFLWPGVSVLAFVLLVGAWAILSGVAMLYGAIRGRGTAGRGWLVLGGIASLVFGVLVILWPLPGALVMTLWLGAYALVFGVAMLLLAFQARRQQRKPRP